MADKDDRLPHITTDKIFNRQDLEEAVKAERERVADIGEQMIVKCPYTLTRKPERRAWKWALKNLIQSIKQGE